MCPAAAGHRERQPAGRGLRPAGYARGVDEVLTRFGVPSGVAKYAMRCILARSGALGGACSLISWSQSWTESIGRWSDVAQKDPPGRHRRIELCTDRWRVLGDGAAHFDLDRGFRAGGLHEGRSRSGRRRCLDTPVVRDRWRPFVVGRDQRAARCCWRRGSRSSRAAAWVVGQASGGQAQHEGGGFTRSGDQPDAGGAGAEGTKVWTDDRPGAFVDHIGAGRDDAEANDEADRADPVGRVSDQPWW